jgi:hypothetical protein
MTLSTAVPKPPKTEKDARKPLPRATKRIARSTEPIKKTGETKRKKVVRQKAFYSSAVWKAMRTAALERAGHRCEHTGVEVVTYAVSSHGTVEIREGLSTWRCEATERLQVHHKTNVRFVGDERPRDLVVWCFHHDMHHHAIQGKKIT